MPVVAFGAELAGEPGELLGGDAGHVAVDGDLDEKGAEDVLRRL